MNALLESRVLELRAPMAGWICPLGEVPDEAFASGLLGQGLAIDPLGEVVCAPLAGEVLAIHAAGHAITLRVAKGLELLLHFGLDTVRLGGLGFTPLVAVGQLVAPGDALLRVDVGQVVDRAKSLIMPMVFVEAAGWEWSPALAQGAVAQGDLLGTLTGSGIGESEGIGARPGIADEILCELAVPLAHGLHARPCAALAECARGFGAVVRMEKGAQSAAITSVSAMLRLGIGHGDTIGLRATGADAQVALEALRTLIASGMGEYQAVGQSKADDDLPPAAGGDGPPVQATTPQPGDRLAGVVAAPGMAVGQAWRWRRAEPQLASVSAGAALEQDRFGKALSALQSDLRAQTATGTTQQQAILAAHLAFLADEELIGAVRTAIAEGAPAAQAWRRVLHGEAEALAKMPDPRFAARASDLLDLELRLQWHLAGGQPQQATPPADAIVLADDLLPSEVAELDLSRVAGLALARGGPTSHMAIIAASRGLPALVALGDGVLAIAEGEQLVLDAETGGLEVAPDGLRVAAIEGLIAARLRRRAQAMASAGEEGRTSDGTRIEIFANLGKLAEAAPALAGGAEGCGLLRTEFLFLDRQTAPDEDEQTAQYAAIARALDGRPLIIRLLDIGGDKPAPYLPIAPEDNPAMGLRGLRVGLARPEVLRSQLRAILRAAHAEGVTRGSVKIMAPMVARLQELRDLRRVAEVEALAMGLALPEIGVMVETPAAAVMADALAAECAFLSIGTNDLTQYTLAMDRGNPAVAAGVDGLDPAVLRLIAQTCAGAARHGRWVGVCGGLASDPLAVPILMGLGVTELSAAPAMVADIKALVRSLALEDCRALAQQALDGGSAAQVRRMTAEFAGRTAL